MPADQLVTLAQVKARIGAGIAVGDTTDDALINELIDQVSGWIETYTGRKLVPEAGATYTFDTEAGYVLRVPRGVRAITTLSVASNHQPDSGGTFTTVPASDYLLRPKAADLPIGWPFTIVQISRGTLSGTVARFGRWDNGAQIVGDFGFAAVPPEVQSVAIDAVVAAYQNRGDGSSSVIGADALAIAPWSQFFGRGSPQKNTLDRFRYMALA